MPKKNITKKKRPSLKGIDLWLCAELLLFVIVGALLAARWYRYQINPDGTSYISIAYKYAHFDIKHAINGYWGPLFSILLVPFLWLHIEPILACKLLSILAGAGILYLFHHLLTREVKIPERLVHMFLWALGPSMLIWILPGPLTPDVLMVLSVLLEVVVFLKFLRNPTTRNIVYLALAGLLVYLTKYVGIYLFGAQVAAIFAVKAFFEKEYRLNLRLFARVIGLFLLFALPVIVTLSVKYHHPTLSTAGKYNQGVLAPEYKGYPHHPLVYSGPITPPNTTAYSAWEDPSNLPVPAWSALQSPANLRYFISSLVYHNLNVARDAILSFGTVVALGFIILITYAVLALKKLDYLPIVLGVTALLTVGAYLPLTTEPRYLWVLTPLSLLAVALFCRDFLLVKRQPHALVYISGALFILLNIWAVSQGLASNRFVGFDIYKTSKDIARVIPAESRVTSDTFAAVHVCMHNDLRCYGLITPSGKLEDDQKLYEHLKQENITYYIDFGTSTSETKHFLEQYTLPGVAITPNVTVYQYRY